MYRILIIEDDNTISSILEEHLKKWGYDVSIIADFSDVLPGFTVYEPHIVLMDINLPYYDGFYWCSKIRELSNVPIVFLSSRDGDGDKIRAITQGGDDYIEKTLFYGSADGKIVCDPEKGVFLCRSDLKYPAIQGSHPQHGAAPGVLQRKGSGADKERMQDPDHTGKKQRESCVAEPADAVSVGRRKLCGRQYADGQRQPVEKKA